MLMIFISSIIFAVTTSILLKAEISHRNLVFYNVKICLNCTLIKSQNNSMSIHAI